MESDFIPSVGAPCLSPFGKSMAQFSTGEMKLPESVASAVIMSVVTILAIPAADMHKLTPFIVEEPFSCTTIRNDADATKKAKKVEWAALDMGKETALVIALLSCWSRAVTSTCSSPSQKGACYASLTGLGLTSVGALTRSFYGASSTKSQKPVDTAALGDMKKASG